MKIKLISKKSLEQLIKIDPQQRDYTTVRYYQPLVRNLYLKRIKLGLDFLGDNKYTRLLDVGFGGGIITPELAQHCEEYIGVDVHKNIKAVEQVLMAERLRNVSLFFSAKKLPVADKSVDCVWCMSVLEFIIQPEEIIQEIKRVAKDEAIIIFGFPIKNKLTDWAYRLIGFRNTEAHKNNHQQLIKLLSENFKIQKTKHFPAWLPLNYALFLTLKAELIR